MAIAHTRIDQYPKFSKLALDHRRYITNYCSQFEPYSDFNFLSLFAWNIDGSTELSILNDNLVIKLPDYIDGSATLSILGKNNIEQSINELIKSGLTCKLIPQEVEALLPKGSSGLLIEDEDNHDYIYDLSEHADFPGKRFSGKRKKMRSFINAYGSDVSVRGFSIQRNDKKTLELFEVFENWAVHREKDDEEVGNERSAIERLLEHAHNFDINCYEIIIDGQIAGFSINESLPNGYVNCHFQKTLLKYSNIDVFFTNYVAKQLLESGSKFINWEQDLGVPGLRHLKRSYHPVKYLKKYAVRTD